MASIPPPPLPDGAPPTPSAPPSGPPAPVAPPTTPPVGAPVAGWAPPPTPAPRSSIGMRLLGIALLLPALAVLVVQHVLPAIATVTLAQQSVSAVGGEASDAPGQLAAGVEMFLESLLPSLLLALPATVLAGLLGLAIAQSARLGWTSRVTQVLLGIVGVVYAPLGVVWASTMLLGIGMPTALVATFAAGLPIATALVATALAAAARGHRRVLGSLLVLAIGMLASGGIAPQLFDVPYTVASPSVAGRIYDQGLVALDLGVGAAITVPLLAWVGLLGLLIVGIVAGARMRLVPGATTRGNVGLGLLGLLAVVLLVAITVAIAVVIALHAGGEAPLDGILVATARSWGGSALMALAAVLVGGLAAFGIGWCRPLGEHSAWLLVLWAPSLLAGPITTMIARFVELSDAELLDSPIAAASPVAIAPVVIVLTPLLLGLREQLRWTAQATTSTIGLGLLLLVAITVVDAQSLLPQLVLSLEPDATLPIMGIRALSTFAGMPLVTSLSPVLVVLAGLAIAAQLLLSSLRLVVGRRR